MALQDHNIEKSDDTEASVGSNRHASEPITPIIPPEGGLTGWLCVIGCSMCMFSTFGFLNAYVPFTSHTRTCERAAHIKNTELECFRLTTYSPGLKTFQ